MKKIQDNVAIVVYIHFLEELQAVLATYKSGTDAWYAVFDKVEKQVQKVKGVEDVCLDHQVWAKVEVSAKTWEGTGKEVDRITQKIFKILERLKNKDR